ncbi:MAG: hypothetical protein R3E08_09865 [Thiotrichaceae bacterium]
MIVEELAKKAKVGELQVYDIMEVPREQMGFNHQTQNPSHLGQCRCECQKTDPKLVTALRAVVLKEDLLPDDSLVGKAKGMMKDLVQMFHK